MIRPGWAVRLALILSLCSSASAQTTSTHCTGYGNTLDCTSTTSPSAQQQYDRDMQQFQQGMAQLGAAIAQRRAAKAAQQAIWAAAATEEARKAAEVARANYDATTAALSRFAADSTPASMAPVNRDLAVEWSLLNGVESRIEARGEQGVRWDISRSWAFTDTPERGKILRMYETGMTTVKDHAVNYWSTAIRFDPVTGVLLLTREGRPQYQTVKPIYESTVHAGTHAFATRMSDRGYDVSAPPGTLDASLLLSAIAAMPGELPTHFRIWIVNSKGEVVPADIDIVGRTTVKEPVGQGSTCSADQVKKEKRDAVTLRISAGTDVETVDVHAAAPHLATIPDLKCRLVRR